MAETPSRKTSARIWFHRLLRWILAPIFMWRFRLSSEHQEVAEGLRPPYLVIPNHVMTFDPFLVSYFIPVPVYFVASDANFRNPFFSWWLRKVGAIATSKAADDLASLRLMLKTLKERKVIGIFAEGQRSWDGASLGIIPSTAKLVKLAKVPVLVSLIKGGYMTVPRWSFHTRRGRVVIEQKLAVSADEAKSLSVDEITERIQSALDHDDSEYQNDSRVPYVSDRSAECLQLVLFYCPSCSSLNTMSSSGRRFFCESCGYTVELTPFYRFRAIPGPDSHSVHFRTIREWSLAQNEFVDNYLRDALASGRPEELFSDDHALMFTGYRLSRLRRRGIGRLSFHMDGIRFALSADPRAKPGAGAAGGSDRFFPWVEVKALNVVYQDQLEFYFGRTLYVFKFPRHDTSAYKYYICSRTLESMRNGTNSSPLA
ncbi:MAG: 1-acyl-sn-glycerol-3-phosphate acyltransferase [Spirochaetales bacterium]|nr:1-acyl-sn-glycerol-3-phosphate acyltransferase [Spirochaetales bacterium]